MYLTLIGVVLILIVLEFVTRKTKGLIDHRSLGIGREQLEENLDAIEGLEYSYGKIYAYNLNGFSLELVDKLIYQRSDLLIINHEIAHSNHYKTIEDSFIFRVFLFLKGTFYLLGIATMLSLVSSIVFSFFGIILKWLLITLIVVQVIHFLIVVYTEFVANKNTGMKTRLEYVFIYSAMSTQILYWFLFITATLTFYFYLFYS